MRSRMRRGVGPLCVGIAALALAGCERFPWESGGGSSAKPAASAPESAGPPPVPFVPEQETVAKVNQTPVSTTDVELALSELKRLMQAYQQTWEPLPVDDTPDRLDLPDVVNNLVDSELRTQDLLARGLSADAKRRWTYVQRSFYSQEWDRWQRERALPADEEVHQFYEQNKAGFSEPERIRASQVVMDTLAEAEAVRSQAVQGAVFSQLARERSVGAGKEQGGDIGWHLRAVDKERLRLMGQPSPEQVFFPQLEPVAFALEVNQVSQPVKGPDGRYYVIQLQERKSARQQTELEVRDAIKELLTLQQVQRQLEQLRQKAQVERFGERLNAVKQ
ncbi:MAG: peptidyl-prolyl cis-trans isomerase [Candidatus Omnitrophica bacterium]|nr:peptidyl-prolyl cis-trans isomerase [Candidatus Omnitrophota bacterium]